MNAGLRIKNKVGKVSFLAADSDNGTNGVNVCSNLFVFFVFQI